MLAPERGLLRVEMEVTEECGGRERGRKGMDVTNKLETEGDGGGAKF